MSVTNRDRASIFWYFLAIYLQLLSMTFGDMERWIQLVFGLAAVFALVMAVAVSGTGDSSD